MQEFEHVYYYIRSYIQGKTLEELCESGLTKPGIPKNQALDYLIQLAELLGFLHKLTPPIIHRDIKPQNVVVDPDGICHLIDMGISRFYDGEKSSDTVIMGTRITAPPEQF
jgi:serine/threonine protein kinase